MSAPYADPGQVRAALLDAGLLVATGVDGLYHRSEGFERVLHGVEEYAAAQRVVPDAPRRWLPPLLPRADFLRTDYVRSFPDLMGSVDVFSGGDADHKDLLADLEAGADWTRCLEPAEVVLSSSACHGLYGTVPTDVPHGGLAYECCGWAFRHEPSIDPARMQCFRMYEFVHVGAPDEAAAHQIQWRNRGEHALGRLGLPVRAEVANDPFFGRVGQMLAANQLDSALKYEIVVDIHAERPTAIGSGNYHLDHFGEPFGLRLPDGEVAHSACFGFGLERITLALFAHHGTELDGWPSDVRELLGC